MRRKLVTVAGLGILAGAGAVWLAAHQPPDRPTEPGPVLTLLVGASLLGCGLASWRARPENRLGPVMVLTAFAWFASQLSETPEAWVYTLGSVVQYVWVIGLIYLLLSFPSGRLPGRLDRWLLGGVCSLFVIQLLAMLEGNKAGVRCPTCPSNLLHVITDNREAENLLLLERLLGSVLVATIIVVLARRWWRASPAQRRAVAPVIVAGCATLAALVWTQVLDLFGDPLSALPATVWFYTTAAVPIAVVFVFVQRRLARGMVAGLVVELGQPRPSADLREALARTLGDPSLELAYWFPAERCYVDGEGRMVKLPNIQSGRSSTFVERDGQPIAVLLHDPVLEHNAELVRSVCAAASLALENERLQAELRARLSELQASRARLVEATDAERRRIERDLHDGTQQRLVSIAMSLGLLESKLPDQEAVTRPLVREAREALAVALEELRELTHGINPPLLTERGLAAALDELCRRAALPARLNMNLHADRRLSDQVESAAYFVASEALTNAAKHSHGSEVRVSASHEGEMLTVEVVDDGIGGAADAGGSGLRGLADRVEALGGRLTVSSPPGRGTSLRAEIPCA
ncbi:MAG TPA: histidine kinase [Solirubrobacteraceae bacterium]|nr:histidine kinase [Solirubrobacteraceae bacterium]